MKLLVTRLAALTAVCLFSAAPALAQDAAPATTETPPTVDTPAEEAAADSADAAATAAVVEAEEEEAEEAEEARESAHGSYEWKPSFGGGLEYGLFFSQLERWNTYVIDPAVAERLDINTLWYLDVAAEASVLEGTRFTIFGGLQRPFDGAPQVRAMYIGLEPAFAFRRDFWELALGVGAAIGRTSLEVEGEGSMDAGLVVLRPFLELRRYLGTFAAVYGRFGFHQWLVNNPEFEGDLQFTGADTNLDEGGPYFALGVRFGHYPEHVKEIGDTDGDGFRDDVDDCPEEPEDVDGFEDEDGCPDLDNDGDGINDDVDKCPNRPEDMDGWQDEDGCPETDDDTDGDGILNDVDQCPNEPEDQDGFEDDDGCPDPDNDNDGIADREDKCPNRPGVAAKQGCPFELVEVTLDKIVIKDKIFFEFNKAVIKPESFGLLDQVVQTLKGFPRIKKVEIQGHTDHAGKADYNLELSQARAKSVFDYLVGKGIDENRLTYKGYGMTQPLVPLPEDGKETPEAAAQNRRVEFVILEQEEVKRKIREDKVPELKGPSSARPVGSTTAEPAGGEDADDAAEEPTEEAPQEQPAEGAEEPDEGADAPPAEGAPESE